MLSGYRCIFYLTVYDSFFQLWTTGVHCLESILPFAFLLYTWFFFSGFIFRMLGMSFSEEDNSGYTALGPMLIFTFESYRSAIGDFNPPMTQFWQGRESQDVTAAEFMVFAIWAMWVLNQFLTLVFGVNFLVA